MKKMIFVAIASMIMLAACTETKPDQNFETGMYRRTNYIDPMDNQYPDDNVGHPDVFWSVTSDGNLKFEETMDSTGTLSETGSFKWEVGENNTFLINDLSGNLQVTYNIQQANSSSLVLIKDAANSPTPTPWNELYFVK